MNSPSKNTYNRHPFFFFFHGEQTAGSEGEHTLDTAAARRRRVKTYGPVIFNELRSEFQPDAVASKPRLWDQRRDCSVQAASLRLKDVIETENRVLSCGFVSRRRKYVIETKNRVLSRGLASRRRKDVIETENRGSSILDAKLRLDRYLSTDAASDGS